MGRENLLTKQGGMQNYYAMLGKIDVIVDKLSKICNSSYYSLCYPACKLISFSFTTHINFVIFSTIV